jgi:hypothetical protein
MSTVALYGAAGKMGTRIAENLQGSADYALLHVESGEAGLARLRARGIHAAQPEVAARYADFVVLAIPDTAIGRVAAHAVPLVRPGTMVICLDPAAPYAGDLPAREDVTHFVVHPCHPPIVNEETTWEARRDFFGGIARQSLVCALMQGPEEDYARGEALCQAMFAPVLRVHRITVEQMAILEPAMAETVTLTLMTVIREALDEAIARGVPEAAARDFILGHMNVNLGILFGFLDAQVSDGAKLAVRRGKEAIMQADWRRVFEPEAVLAEVRAITAGLKA